jgi:hypothetical protein
MLLARGPQREEAIVRLLAAGASSIERLEPLADDDRLPIQEIFRRLEGPGVVEELIRFASTKKRGARRHAADALAYRREPRAIPVLLETNRRFFFNAEALARIGDVSALAPLRAQLAAALGASPASTIAELAAKNDRSTLGGLADAAGACAQLGDATVLDPFLALLGADLRASASDVLSIKEPILSACAWAPNEATTRAVLGALRDPLPDVRRAAARRIGELRLPAAFDRLLEVAPNAAFEHLLDSVPDPMLAGDVPPPVTAKWWTERRRALAPDVCLWRGEPETPGRIVEHARSRFGMTARRELELLTGFELAVNPGAPLDVERFQAWWAPRAATWRAGGLYRAGRAIPVAPVLAALDTPAPRKTR